MNELTGQEKALLNKIFRATHDGVCAKCGSDMVQVTGYRCLRTSCSFSVSLEEMSSMECIIADWGKEAVKFFEKWRSVQR
jgi:hypothetical protein